ncbi:MAG: chromate transporter [Clostridia bacterium]|nr:chromate transporter [Clostridia bacterium]
MKNILWRLFGVFFKIGLFTFGGGYAMISVIEREVVDKRGWCSKEDMMDMVVIAESTPGVIAVNSATFVGYKTAGILGAIIATLGVILPSFLIISGLYFAMDAFLTNVYVAAAFKGVRICVAVLIFRAVISLFNLMDKKAFCFVLLIGAFVVATFTDFNVIFIILIGAAIGLIYTNFIDKKQKVTFSVEDDDQRSEK